MGNTRRATYLIQDPFDEDAQRFIERAERLFGLKPVCFYTSAKGRFYAEREWPTLRSEHVEAAYTVDDWETFANEVIEQFDVQAIVPYREDTVEVAAELLKYIDVDWNSPDVLARFRDKHLMKSTLREQAVRAPLSWKITTASDLDPAVLPNRFVVKPNDGFGNEAVGYFGSDSSLAEIDAHIDGSTSTQWVVEAFINGPEFHVDGQVRSDGTVTVLGVSEYQRVDANGYTGVYSGEWNCPSTHPLFEQLSTYATEVITALGLRRCPFHLELIVDPDGPCVIDLGARFPSESGGEQLSRLHPSRPDAYTVAMHDFLGDNDVATAPIDWAEHDANLQVVVYGISHEHGVMNKLSGVEQIEADPEFVSWAVKPSVGTPLVPTTALRGTTYVAYFRYDGTLEAAHQRIDDVHRIVQWESTGLSGHMVATLARSRRLCTRARWEANRVGQPLTALRASPGYLHEVTTDEEWSELAADVEFATHAHTETVKFVIDLADDSAVYFLDSTRYELHVDFVRRHIDPLVDVVDFNVSAYRSPRRRYLLGSVLHYRDADRWTIELTGIDNMTAFWINTMFEMVSSRMAIGPRLEFRPVSMAQELIASDVDHPIVTSDELFGGLEFQAVVPGTAVGVVRVLDHGADLSRLRPTDIAVVPAVPEQVPPVAAVITSQFQTPLSHLAVLCRNRDTVDMALRDAISDDRFRAHDGEFVRLTVDTNDFTIERATAEEAETAAEASRPEQGSVPHADCTDQPFVHLGPGAINDSVDIAVVGAKAHQLSQLAEIDRLTTLDAFVVPFGCYAEHLQRATGLDGPAISKRLSDVAPDQLAVHLADLRAAITTTDVDSDLCVRLAAAVASLAPGQRVILRSSTNAEDLEGFSGAGLYESIAAPTEASEAELASTLREVWASVWLERAVREREWFRIDHAGVAMAVVVQPFVDDAIGVGVALTRNPIDPRADAALVNVQVPGAGVTGATTDIAEQLVIFTVEGGIEADVISHSSRNGGAPLLTQADLADLAAQLELIHTALLPQHGPESNAMDVEFVVGSDRSVTIVQARPYTIPAGADFVPWTTTRRIAQRLRATWARFSPKQRRMERALETFDQHAPVRSAG